ncbi:hypothetical protein WJX73_004164 [Symbiochloris irregularis]|uniref:Cilia-and flagella-associated protein 96 n=1 Tax=Symbiochloris irregularis TaxID=706552 RepID=A0AAW1PJI3_9CHLO
MATKYGQFSEPGYLKPGATYLKVKAETKAEPTSPERPSFRAGRALRTGKLNDATFSKFQSTNVNLGDGFADTGRGSQASSTGRGSIKAVGSPFKPASPLKHSAAQAGDYTGTFSKFEATKASPAAQRKKGDFKAEPKNIVVTGPKSGGYGRSNFTLSQRIKGSKGVAGEYEYMAEPCHVAKRAPQSDKAPPAPFRPAQGTSRHGVFSKLEYKSPGAAEVLTKQKVEEKQLKGPAFAPPSAACSPLTPVPYLANPLPEAKHHKKDGATKAAWRPGQGTRSGLSPSIMRMNV